MNYLQNTIQQFGEFAKRNLEFFSRHEKVWNRSRKCGETAESVGIRNLNIYSFSDAGVKGSV